jgi:phage shock protein C
MSIADDLTQLEQMHQRGSLTDAEFLSAKQRCLSGNYRAAEPLVSAINGLRRTEADRWLGGVCGGLALATGMQAWLWRIVFLALTTFGGAGVFVYVVLWLFVPLERNLPALPAPRA